MNATTESQAPIEHSLQAAFARLIERAIAKLEGTTPGQVLRWLPVLVAVSLGWRLVRSFRTIFWSLFGLGMALWWTSPWHIAF